MFVVFVAVDARHHLLGRQAHPTAKEFYAAGGGVTGLQNGLAIAGDYMSAASFLGISALVYSSRLRRPDLFGRLAGRLADHHVPDRRAAAQPRPVHLRRRRLVSGFKQTPIRALAASGTLVTVAFYLIAQMVGAGAADRDCCSACPICYAVVIVGVLMIIYVTFGGMIATTWVQIIKAGLLLVGATLMALLVLGAVRLRPQARCSPRRSRSIPQHRGDHVARRAGHQPDLGDLAGHGADVRHRGLPHILMRFFTVGNAKEARKSVFCATAFIGYFYILTFIIGFGAIVLVSTEPGSHRSRRQGRLLGGGQHGGDPSRRTRSAAI